MATNPFDMFKQLQGLQSRMGEIQEKLRGVRVTGCRPMGNEAQHLRLKLKQDGTAFEAVAFKLGDSAKDISESLDIVYNLELDRWSGIENLRLNISSFNPSPFLDK